VRARLLAAVGVTTAAAVASTAAVTSASAAPEQPAVVEQVPVPEFAQLESSDRVPHPRVDAVESHRGLTFVGGHFDRLVDSAGSHDRVNVAVLSSSTGQVVESALRVNGDVLALRARGRFLYVGGSFTQVGDQRQRFLAKVDAATGELVPDFRPTLDGPVKEIETSGRRVFVGGAFTGALASVNRRTGTATPYLQVPISGVLRPQPGRTSVNRFAVNPARTRLVAVGNFTKVGGEVRKRAFMLDLRPHRSRLARWYYPPLGKRCRVKYSPKVASVSDVDFSPDGRYFVFGATGGSVRRRADIGTQICDAVARFESNNPSPAAPTWINYTGSDTVWTVEATGAAIYAEGHFRWVSNPLGHNSEGPGAVDRRGLAALDPGTGRALSWHPDMPSKRGGRALLSTPEGLWAGSDALKVGGQPRHGLAFFRLPGEGGGGPS
jgi:hypothetical protein